MIGFWSILLVWFFFGAMVSNIGDTYVWLISVAGFVIATVAHVTIRAKHQDRDKFAQVYTDNHGYPDIFHELEPLEREQTAPETRVLEVLSDNKDAPITYLQLADLVEPLNENDIKVAIKSLESKGHIEVSSAGNLGNYYHVNDLEKE